MIVLAILIVPLLALLVPALALAAGDAVPPGFPSAGFFATISTEKAAPIAGLIVTFVTQMLRSSAFSGWVTTLPRRQRILVPLGLSAVVAVVGPWLGIVGWDDAVKLGLETAASSVFLAEVVIANALGQRTGEAPAKAAAASPSDPLPPSPPAT